MSDEVHEVHIKNIYKLLSKVEKKLENVSEVVGRVEVQTTKTNGRVTGLERSRDIINKEIDAIKSNSTKMMYIIILLSSGATIGVKELLRVFGVF